jgi:Protein of unknown function (DUF4065)
LRWGWSLTGDRYVSMEHGCVLSNTYDLIREEKLGPSYWKQFISPPLGEYEVTLVSEPANDELSKAERELVEEVYKAFGYQNRWRLRDYTHGLPEYKETNGPSIPMSYAEVMRGERIPDEQIESILEELDAIAELDQLAR